MSIKDLRCVSGFLALFVELRNEIVQFMTCYLSEFMFFSHSACVICLVSRCEIHLHDTNYCSNHILGGRAAFVCIFILEKEDFYIAFTELHSSSMI